MEQHSRRDLIRIAAGAVAAAPLVGQSAPAFFTPEEFRMVDELSEIIIPADDHSPGARAAKCASFIDQSLAWAANGSQPSGATAVLTQSPQRRFRCSLL